MSNAENPNRQTAVELRDEWLTRLEDLIRRVQGDVEAQGWSTRRIEKKMEDSEIGVYQAPALLLQEETTRILLEPIARSAPGVEGVVHLYLMPAYDDIASLYYHDGDWHVQYTFPGASTAGDLGEGEAKLLSDETLQEVMEEMKKNAV